jgi:hypothetical protein
VKAIIEAELGNTTDNVIKKYDTSNQKISGHFVIKDGIISRENPQVKNHYMFYKNTGKAIVCVDCTGDYINPDLFQVIILESHSFTYIDKYANVTVSWNSYSDRHMAGCNIATIAYSDAFLNPFCFLFFFQAIAENPNIIPD